MNVELPNDVNEFVKDLVVSGRYQSEQEAVAEGLRLLMSREQLRKDIAGGFEKIDAGESVGEDELFQQIKQTISDVEKSRRGT